MSWTEIFPRFDEDMVERYQTEATGQEKAAVGAWFEVEAIHNERRVKHVVATGLFWKPAAVGERDYPPALREVVMQTPGKYGLSSRFKNPWEHYVEPIFEAVRHLAEIRPYLVYRVYLPNDLDFLIPELVEAGCEVLSFVRRRPPASRRNHELGSGEPPRRARRRRDSQSNVTALRGFIGQRPSSYQPSPTGWALHTNQTESRIAYHVLPDTFGSRRGIALVVQVAAGRR